jgi:hypothetical protein
MIKYSHFKEADGLPKPSEDPMYFQEFDPVPGPANASFIMSTEELNNTLDGFYGDDRGSGNLSDVNTARKQPSLSGNSKTSDGSEKSDGEGNKLGDDGDENHEIKRGSILRKRPAQPAKSEDESIKRGKYDEEK